MRRNGLRRNHSEAGQKSITLVKGLGSPSTLENVQPHSSSVKPCIDTRGRLEPGCLLQFLSPTLTSLALHLWKTGIAFPYIVISPKSTVPLLKVTATTGHCLQLLFPEALMLHALHVNKARFSRDNLPFVVSVWSNYTFVRAGRKIFFTPSM